MYASVTWSALNEASTLGPAGDFDGDGKDDPVYVTSDFSGPRTRVRFVFGKE